MVRIKCSGYWVYYDIPLLLSDLFDLFDLFEEIMIFFQPCERYILCVYKYNCKYIFVPKSIVHLEISLLTSGQLATGPFSRTLLLWSGSSKRPKVSLDIALDIGGASSSDHYKQTDTSTDNMLWSLIFSTNMTVTRKWAACTHTGGHYCTRH